MTGARMLLTSHPSQFIFEGDSCWLSSSTLGKGFGKIPDEGPNWGWPSSSYLLIAMNCSSIAFRQLLIYKGNASLLPIYIQCRKHEAWRTYRERPWSAIVTYANCGGNDDVAIIQKLATISAKLLSKPNWFPSYSSFIPSSEAWQPHHVIWSSRYRLRRWQLDQSRTSKCPLRRKAEVVMLDVGWAGNLQRGVIDFVNRRGSKREDNEIRHRYRYTLQRVTSDGFRSDRVSPNQTRLPFPCLLGEILSEI